ncbi:hypothetical protein [Nocardiopsis sp. TNDT3]|uniref:hypothetical protein n=1 Tax=Nocardiopsis sp. TNDT3 TaxID=2249354 RepID=UPI000E3C18FC|nr:hypothetical protein [Nocardiopsis sp. TNDT3]
MPNNETTKPNAPEFTPEELTEARNARISRESGIRPEFIPYLKGNTVEEITAAAAFIAKTLPHTRVGNAPADRVGRMTPRTASATSGGDEGWNAEGFRDVDGRPDASKLAAAIRTRMPY